MKTYISDKFPLTKLECQYIFVCKSYQPDDCLFSKECPYYFIINDQRMFMRDVLRVCLEDYVAKECLNLQIKLELEER